MGNVRKPTVNTFKTNVLDSGRHSIFQPCTSFMHIMETRQSVNRSGTAPESMLVFNRTENDNKPAPSVEDTIFMKIMDINVYRDDANSLVAPLPVRELRRPLPNNNGLEVNRFAYMQQTLKIKVAMQEQNVTFMKKMFANGHAEEAPPLREEECSVLVSPNVWGLSPTESQRDVDNYFTVEIS